jgi:hypothetical protein
MAVIKKKKPATPKDVMTGTSEMPTQSVNIFASNKPTADPFRTAEKTIQPDNFDKYQADYKGQYSDKAGGYVTKEGKLYPTTNPNFAPDKIPAGLTPTPLYNGYKNVEEQKKFQGYDKGVQAAEKQQQAQQAVTQAQQPTEITQQDILNAVPQETGLEMAQVAGGAIGGAIGGATGGAGIGAGIGALLAPATAGASIPVGAAIGGTVGGAIGLIGGAYGVITADKRGDVKQASKVGKIANTNFGQTIDALNSGIITKDEALTRWRNDKTSLYAAQANLKRDTDGSLDRFLSGGADEMALVEGYVYDLETIYQLEFEMALMQPNPNNIKYRYSITNDDAN